MDPLQAIAARQVAPARKSPAEEIDAFYNDNALERLYSARRALGQFAKLLRAIFGRLRGLVRQSPEFASAP